MAAGGVHGGKGEGACVVYDEIRSMNGWYASYWNAFLFIEKFQTLSLCLALLTLLLSEDENHILHKNDTHMLHVRSTYH